MTLRVIKETKRYGRTDARSDNVKTVYPLQTKFAGGIIIKSSFIYAMWCHLHIKLLLPLFTLTNGVDPDEPHDTHQDRTVC